ncbi:MAG: WG repeat-containing protein [Cytophagales bacterium]|jgi:hypothetical protein|nr:WG repeat-containing protein [Cytophagales bacterium]
MHKETFWSHLGITAIICLASTFLVNSQNADTASKNCCNHQIGQAKLDSIKKHKVFGHFTETEPTKNPHLIPFRQGEKWGFANSKYEIKIPVRYDSVGLFWEDKTHGFIASVKVGDTMFYINKSGDSTSGPNPPRKEFYRLYEMVKKAIYKNLRDLDKVNYFTQIDKKYGFKTERGVRIAPSYTNYGFVDGGLVTMKNEKGWVLLDTLGNRLSGEFDTITHFSNRSFAIVKQGDKYGMIDRNGKFIRKPKHNELNYFIYDAQAVLIRKGDKYGLLDMSGKKIIKPKYRLENPSTYYYTECYLFSDSRGRHFYMDDHGNKYVGE